MNKEFKKLIEKRNAGLCFIVLSIIFVVTGIFFIPLAIVDEYFVALSIEAFLVYIFFIFGVFLFIFGLFKAVSSSKKIKTFKDEN